MFTDSHSHLDRVDLKPFAGSMATAMQHFRAAGLSQQLCVGIHAAALPEVLQLASDYDDIYASVGIHPNEKWQESGEITQAELLNWANHPRVVAIGETGLDYFRQKRGSDLSWQQQRFRTHIAAAKVCGKPLIIHCREAKDDTLRILQEENAAAVGGVMHCFVEDWETAAAALEIGFYISFSGIITFNNAAELCEVAARVPEDRLLIETDSPYLTPAPFRGDSNTPAHVRYVAEKLAAVRQCTVAEVAAITTANFNTLFKIAA
ncbi:MAG: TatD family hydrolase [Gammaproteobacteria bacterium]|nr:TatD family hydrolase [Gammaproteobacteria bacterium]